jgi:hypothetical protein
LQYNTDGFLAARLETLLKEQLKEQLKVCQEHTDFQKQNESCFFQWLGF